MRYFIATDPDTKEPHALIRQDDDGGYAVYEIKGLLEIAKGDDNAGAETPRRKKKAKLPEGTRELSREEFLAKHTAGKKKGVRHCKKCGKAGHRSDGCPEGGAKDPDLEDPENENDE